MKKLAFAFTLGFACTLQAWGAADRYLDCDCSLNGDGTVQACATSGGGAGAWNTPTSLSLSAGDRLRGRGTCYDRGAGTCYLVSGCAYPDFDGRRHRVPPNIGAFATGFGDQN